MGDRYERTQPAPYDESNLGVFMYFLIKEMESNACTPPTLEFLSSDASLVPADSWHQETSNQALGGTFVTSADSAATASWDVNIPSDGAYQVSLWFPQSPKLSRSVKVEVNDVTGTYSTTLSQQSYGARWFLLGDYYFIKGAQNNAVRIFGSPSGMVAANAIRIVKYPECYDSPGATCQDFVPKGPTCPTSE